MGDVTPIWRTIRIVVTSVMIAIGGLILWAACEIAGNVTGAAVAWMVWLAALLPAGFLAMFTIAGWQRSGAPPNPAIAWCADRRRYPLIWTGFVVLLFGSVQLLMGELNRGDAEQAATEAYNANVRETLSGACYANATRMIGAAATADVPLNLRAPHFCICVDIAVERAYTPQQFADVPSYRWWQGGDAKLDRIMQNCRLHDSSVVRAMRLILKAGGDPDSAAARPKVLDYAACVDLEIRDDYDAAEAGKISADPAAQDRDATFAPIVAKCLHYAGL